MLDGFEKTGRIGIQITTPEHLLHVKCDCGNELFIDGERWGIKFHGPVDFLCPCGKVISSPKFKK